MGQVVPRGTLSGRACSHVSFQLGLVAVSRDARLDALASHLKTATGTGAVTGMRSDLPADTRPCASSGRLSIPRMLNHGAHDDREEKGKSTAAVPVYFKEQAEPL